MMNEWMAIARDFFVGRISFQELPHFILWALTHNKQQEEIRHVTSWKITL